MQDCRPMISWHRCLYLIRTCYFAILARTWVWGCHPPPFHLRPYCDRVSQQRRTESLECSESNHPRFYYLRSHFDLARKGQTKMLLFSKINVFANSFWTEEGSKAKHHRVPRVETHRNIDMHFDPKRSIWKFDHSPVKCHDLINDPGRSCPISGDASWQDKYNDISPMALTLFLWSYWPKRFCDLRWRHIPIITSYDLYGFAGQQLRLTPCQIAFESSRTARFIMDVEK